MDGQLTPDAFKQRIVTKYPDGVSTDGTRYADMDSTELTKRIVQKYPQGVTSDGVRYDAYLPKEANPLTQEAPKKSFMQKVGGVAGSLYNTIAKPFVGLAATPVQAGAKALGLDDPYTHGVPSIAGKEKPTEVSELGLKQKAGDAMQVGSYFLPGTGIKTLATVGALQGAGSAMSEDKDLGEIATRGAFGAGTGAALGAVSSAVRNAPKLLSYTSDVPEEAFKTMLARPTQFKAATKAGMGSAEVLKVAQGAEKQLRKQLSGEWDESVNAIINEFPGTRTNFAGNLGKKLVRISDEFGIDLPQNLNNVSVKEGIELVKRINELPKGMLTLSPKGVMVREVKRELQSKIIKEFGGQAGSVSKLWKNYSAKKEVFDAANDILQTYKTGKPLTQTTARNRLMSVFDDGKEAYIAAIRDLEEATGQEILSKIAAMKFQSGTPGVVNAVKIGGGIASPKGSIDKLIDLIAYPLTSPKSAGRLARWAEKVKTPVSGVAETLGRTGLVTRGLLGGQ